MRVETKGRKVEKPKRQLRDKEMILMNLMNQKRQSFKETIK